MSKISIRFFNDKEVRAVWDDEKSKWWFSVLDIIGVLRGVDDYTKNRNYWKYLKAKLKKENIELVSATTQLKLTAADGKKYLTDTFDYDGIIALFSQSPDFDESKSSYQIKHITGELSGTDGYTPPECSTMKTNGICFEPDELCARETVNHPLTYYRIKSGNYTRRPETKE